jgi:hypothetical protein
LVAIRSTAALFLAAVLGAAFRPRTRPVRVVILALLVPLLGGAIMGTLRLSDLSSSCFIREAQLAKSQSDADSAASRQQVATAAATAC